MKKIKFTKEEIKIYNKVRYHKYLKKKNTERVRLYRLKKKLKNAKSIPNKSRTL